jgi:hypothetical protein
MDAGDQHFAPPVTLSIASGLCVGAGSKLRFSVESL